MKYNNFCKKTSSIDNKDLKSEILISLNKGMCTDEDRNKIRHYCHCSINDISYNNEENRIYDYYIKNILKNMHFDGNLEEDDIRTVIQYLSLKMVKDMGINVKFSILPGYYYTLKYGVRSVSSCMSRSDGSSIILLRDSLFKMCLDEDNAFDKHNMFSLLDNIYHEISHAYQNHIICNSGSVMSKNVLLWIKENIIENYDAMYYYVNYNNMHIERDATVQGRQMSLSCIKENFRYFGLKFIYQLENEAFDHYRSTKELKHLCPRIGYSKKEDATMVIDDYIDIIAQRYPSIIHQKLGVQYDCNGQRRSAKSLTDEYLLKKACLEADYYNNPTLYKDKLIELNELYNYLIDSAKESELCIKSRDRKIKSLK